MQAYYELRKWLADAFPDEVGWRRAAAEQIQVDLSGIDLGGSAIDAWTNILAAAHTSHCLALLHDLVVKENPDRADLVTRYAADLKAGFLPAPEMPEVQAVEIADGDLDHVAATRALTFQDTLPDTLFGMALSEQKPSLDEDRRCARWSGSEIREGTSRSIQDNGNPCAECAWR
jgi:hypothetical protein